MGNVLSLSSHENSWLDVFNIPGTITFNTEIILDLTLLYLMGKNMWRVNQYLRLTLRPCHLHSWFIDGNKAFLNIRHTSGH